MSDFYFDPRTGCFHRTDSKAFISRKEVLDLTRKSLKTNEKLMADLADQLQEGSLTIREFQIQSAKLLRAITIQQAALAKGGLDRLTPEDQKVIADELVDQFYAGRDQNGHRFGLRWLADAIRQGVLSIPQIRYSLKMYARSAKKVYQKLRRSVNKAVGKLYAIRQMNPAEHCEDCIRYAAEPPKPVDEVVLPCHNCQCGNNCKCDLVYLTLEEAIARGMVYSRSRLST